MAAITPRTSIVWALALRVAGADVSSRLTGTVTIDREEGAAGLATFVMQPPAGAVDPLAWIGKDVEIDYVGTADGERRTARRFTGKIAAPRFDPVTRLLTCECSDQLQNRIEAMSLAQVDALVGGQWSSDLFEPAEGRSRWDYAQERLGTLTASLDASPRGDLRVTSWYAQAPAFTFGAGTSVFGSVSVSLAELDSLTNVVELAAGVRWPRLWQQSIMYAWAHPKAGGATGLNGFCLWRKDSTELPTTEMIAQAVEGAGLKVTGRGFTTAPLSMPNPCGDGIPWINQFDNLALEARVTGTRRWVQQVTEALTLRVEAPGSVSQAGELIARNSLSIGIEDDRSDTWEDGATQGGPTQFTDLVNASRREQGLRCGLAQAVAEIVSSHRETAVSWQAPAAHTLDVDLVHTLELSDQGVRARGKCRRIQEEYSFDSGSALVTLTIAVMRGGGTVTDALTVPAVSTAADSLAQFQLPGGNPLETQLGGRTTSPAYRDDLDGFAGNWSTSDDTTAVKFTRRFDVTAPEVSEKLRDEDVRKQTATYRLAIPNDLLEL